MSTAQWGGRYLAAMRWAIPPALRSEAALLTRAQNVVNAAIIAGLSGPLYALAYYWLGFDAAAREILLCCLVMLCAPPVLRCTGSIVAARELFLGAVLFNFTWLSYHLGGITAPTATWLLTAPMVAMFLGGVRTALCWLCISCAALAALYFLQHDAPTTYQVQQLPTLHLLCSIGLMVVVTVFVLLFELTKTQGFVHLEQALRTINELAIRDELTGTYNRRHLMRLIERASERDRRFSLCLLDIDFFKRINDTYGHSAGDAVLRAFAQAVQSQVRPGDTFGRYGGEEFLLMLPDTLATSAQALADRVRLAIEQMRCAEVGADVVLTVSIGIAEFIPGEAVSLAVGRADAALYMAKSSGRNRVICHGDTTPALAVPAGPFNQDAPAPDAGGAPPVDTAQTDMLTGLLNRRTLRARLQEAMQRADRNSRPLALLLFNINRFREINEALGVEAGDAALVHTAALLRGALREADAVARWSGDEFIAVLEDAGGEVDARQVATKIIDRFAAPLVLGQGDARRQCFVTASVGIALYPSPDPGLDALLRRAGQALASARLGGGHSIELACTSGPARRDERLALKDGLRTVLADGQLLLEYQPQVDLLTRRVVGVETLIRWQHPHFGRIEPARFIALAEETGLIVPIGDWVLKTACAQHRAWVEAGLPAIKIAVNLSARQLKDPGLAARVLQLVAQAGVTPRCLELEITEGVLMDDLARNRTTLAALRGAGLQVSIDDFSTGYSSLNYLSELPVDILKMDGQFVRRLGSGLDERCVRAQAIAEAIVSIAHKLGLKVIAEAVETEEQYVALAQLGCDQAQGFLFHRPLHPDAVAALLMVRPRLVVDHGIALRDLVALRLP